jgi:hypothetical protein
MRVSTKFALALATLLFGFLFVPRDALAQTSSNCPVEPATNVPIALGEVFAGTNCNLNTDGDIDSFVFSGTSGDTYEIAAAINGASQDICLTLVNPSFIKVFNGCTSIFNGVYSVVAYPKLTASGTYTMEVTEPSSVKQNYGVSLQRLFPFPSYATAVPKFNDPLSGNVAQLTDTNFFTFPAATTGNYLVTGTLPSNPSHDLCGTVYFSNFTNAGTKCTSIFNGIYNFQFNFTPTTAQAGTVMVAVQEAGNDGSQTYTFEVACAAGTCPIVPVQPPPCTLSDTASYSSTTSTLTMQFTIGNNLGTPGIWNAWLTYPDLQGTDPDTMQLLFSKSQPITNPPTTSTTTYSLPKEGRVGVLSTLSTPPSGIACFSWVLVNTGTEPPAISSFSPTSGPAGTKVVITGQSLTGATSVTFGGVKATSFTLNSDTQITATVPAGAKTGTIGVTTPGGTATSAGTFSVT